MGDPTVARKTVELRNKLGLHARAAAKLVKLADPFHSELQIRLDDQVVNGKSILGLMMLAASVGSKIELIATGDDAQEMIAVITALIEAKFDEDQ
ncbi:MAG TPA: HPr family phosphocarrier protein [Candidatus Bathyarchaeia archaeon]|nr:HPr family phosphocarrier protein [Candidatus Bathyarchaeia archaeon]